MTVVTFQTLVYSGSPESKKLFHVKPGTIDLKTFQVPKGQILIEAKSWALNPIDWKAGVYGLAQPHARVGTDVSGTVVKVASDVDDFQVGDDVSSLIAGNFLPEPHGPGAFSGYVLADAFITFNFGKGGLQTAADSNGIIPSGKIDSFEAASAIPLSLVTSSTVFNNEFEFGGESKLNSEGQTILIWGGATSTGIIGIQLAKFVYKMNVIAVASSKNHEFLKSIGASWTYDYHDSDVVQKIKAEHKYIKYGFNIASTMQTLQQVYDTVDNDAIVVSLLDLDDKAIKTTPSKKVTFHSANVYLVFGKDLQWAGHVIKAPEGIRIDFEDFRKHKLTQSFLKNHLIHPKLKVVAHGNSFLKSIEEGLDLLRENKVSGEKIVIRASDVEN